MFKEYKNQVELFHFDNLSKYDYINHFVSTRKGGESEPPYDSLNFGLNSGDNPLKVIRNRERLAETIGISAENFVTLFQVHGAKVRIINMDTVSEEQSHSGMPKIKADAMVTNLKHFCLTVSVADCVPILFYDPVSKTIGVAHAGWKGTVQKVTVKTVETMVKEFGSRESDIIAGIGPSIGPCCYEVGTEVIAQIEKAFDNYDKFLIAEKKGNQATLDLWLANKYQLIDAGLDENNIEMANLCTMCNPDRFYSYRQQGEKYGRQAAGIMLK